MFIMSDCEETESVTSLDWVETDNNEEDEFLFAPGSFESGETEGTGAVEKAKGKGKGRKSKSQPLKVPLATCHLCRSPFHSLESYSRHLKAHLFEDGLKHGPGDTYLQEFCRNAAKTVLEGMRNTSLQYGLNEDLKRLCGALLTLPPDVCNIFVDCVSDELLKCIPLPSQISVGNFHSKYLKDVMNIVHSVSVRDQVLSILKDIVDGSFSEEVLNVFKTTFILKLSDSLECYFLKSIREPCELLVYGVNPDSGVSSAGKDDLDDINFQQSVHYIGGSCVRSVISLGFMYRDSEKWQRLAKCAKTKMLVETLANAPVDSIESWTAARDRGGLKYISEEVWTILMALSSVLKTSEAPDGSINYDTVISSVLNDDILMQMWNAIIGDDLEQEEGNYLLQVFCKKYINAWGNGIALRRKNAMPNANKGKVALRSQLSR